MRSVPVLAAVALGAVVLASGCGQQHAGTPAGPPLSASASAAPAPSPVPGDPGTTAKCGSAAPPIALIRITYADNGRTLWSTATDRRAGVLDGHADQPLVGHPREQRCTDTAFPRKADPEARGDRGVVPGRAPGNRHSSLRSSSLAGPNTTPGNSAAQSGVLECGVITIRLPRHGEGRLTANECGGWHTDHLLLSWLPQRRTRTRLTSWFSWRGVVLITSF